MELRFLMFGLIAAALVTLSSCKNKTREHALLCYVGGTMRPVKQSDSLEK